MAAWAIAPAGVLAAAPAAVDRAQSESAEAQRDLRRVLRGIPAAESAPGHLDRRPALQRPLRRRHRPAAIAAERKAAARLSGQGADRRPLGACRPGPAVVRRVQDGARARDRGLPVPGRADPAQPVLLDAEQLCAARFRQRHAAVQDGAGLRQFPQAPRRLRRLDRPGDRQHEAKACSAATRCRRCSPSARCRSSRRTSSPSPRIRCTGGRSRRCRPSFPPPTASA